MNPPGLVVPPLPTHFLASSWATSPLGDAIRTKAGIAAVADVADPEAGAVVEVRVRADVRVEDGAELALPSCVPSALNQAAISGGPV